MTHPRDRFDLIPSEKAEQVFLDTWRRGRLHHAWLLCGPEGMGKATFAYRAARHLLGADPDALRGPLGASPHDPTAQLISAQSHPDLLVLERATEGGKTKRNISVDQARELPEFFAMSPSRARYRVAIIDAADDLNINAANALLKILEEPPERGVVFMVAHAPGRLLPTIRSRCRRLTFDPWARPQLIDLIRERAGTDDQEAERIAALAHGSPGAALALADEQVLAADRLAREWVSTGVPDAAAEIAQAAGFRGGEGADRFDRLYDRLLAAVHDQATRGEGAAGAAWAEAWSRMAELPAQVASVNLDRADVLAVALAEIGRAQTVSRSR